MNLDARTVTFTRAPPGRGDRLQGHVADHARDAAGNAFVAGYTFGGLDGNASAGGDDLFVVKYGPDGRKR